MNAPMAYLNRAGKTRLRKRDDAGLEILNTLLSSANCATPIERGSSQGSEKNPRPPNRPGPGKFKNDPDDPKNPNEERKRFLKKIDKRHNR